MLVGVTVGVGGGGVDVVGDDPPPRELVATDGEGEDSADDVGSLVGAGLGNHH